MAKIKAPKYIPAEVMRNLTRPQLKILMTQKNTRGLYSENANRAQKILWQSNGRASRHTGISSPLTLVEKGWCIPEKETVDLEPWLNGTEVGYESRTDQTEID